ncbi:ABC transporter permease [Paenibacillus sacheonensis]|uniref:Transport permease protein n=1 Tax=Paenibacillus sacheonensis TaxID=742054 RepID=A0A7X4YVH0_9BACL|nr:ABC transporter permease [Paenibacillus sacheonensis]MBM7567976.1 ABC-2 type transport system permease protein [Paenibacillus sacheonensis]NBC73183.1 ABC transporter permease [Paenibacillus sacheonensis]
MKTHVSNLVKYKDLFLELIIKDIKLKYRNSLLGVLWSMLNPLLMMVVLSIVFMEFFKNNIANFPVYVLTGRIVYQYFADATNFAMDSIHANGQLIRKVYVPKYFFPLSRVFSTLFTAVLSLVPLALTMMVTGLSLRWMNLLVIVPIFYLLVITAGIALILAAITVFFNDLKHMYSIVLMILMYMTPIFYPISIIPEKYLTIIKLNPIYPIVDMFRDVLLYGTLPSLTLHLICVGYMVVYAGVGLLVFYKSQDRFIYHL